MLRSLALASVLSLLGCAAEGVKAPDVQAPDADSDLQATRRGVPDAGSPDVVPFPDTRPAVDVQPKFDTQVGVDAQPLIDTQPQPAEVQTDTLPDGISYPHDLGVLQDGVLCMKQLVANGYASDKESCATIGARGFAVGPGATSKTVEGACIELIDCLVANPNCTWYNSVPCINSSFLDRGSSPNWTPLGDLIKPFCPTFFSQ